MPAATEADLRAKLPPAAADYCVRLWREVPFRLVIRQPSRGSLGLFVSRPGKGHTIYVNIDLNPYAFLVTYLHEVAHHRVFLTQAATVKPHGPEWKAAFRDLLLPVLTPNIFPVNVLLVLQKYAADPKASSCSDPRLVQALALHDVNKQHLKPLGMQSPGTRISYEGRYYTVIAHRRTRTLIRDDKGAQFLMSQGSLVAVEAPATLFTLPPVTVGSLQVGTRFKLGSRHFEKVEQKTSRALCREVSTGKLYWVQGHLEPRS